MLDRNVHELSPRGATAEGSARQAAVTGLLIAIPLIALSVAALWWLSRPNPEVRIDTADTPADQAATVSAAEAAWPALTRARRALERGRIVSPAGDNAFEIYLGVPVGSPDHLGATQALLELVPLAVRKAESDIASGQLDEAERIRQLIARADPASLAVVNLEREIARARAARANQNEPSTIGAAPTLAITPTLTPAANTGFDASTRLSETTNIPAAAESVATPAPVSIPARSVAQAMPASALERADAIETATAGAADASPATRTAPSAARGADIASPPQTGAEAGTTLINPVPLNDVAPRYPVQAMRMRQEGSVVLEFVIQVDGSVRDVRIVQSNPPQVFDREALRTAMRWRFEPRQVDGQPVEARARRTINFRLGT